MELHRLRASQVSVAQQLHVIYQLISIDIGVKGVLWTGMATDELIVKYAI